MVYVVSTGRKLFLSERASSERASIRDCQLCKSAKRQIFVSLNAAHPISSILEQEITKTHAMSNKQMNWEESSYNDTTLVLSDEERLNLERRTAADMAAYHAEALNEGGIPVHPDHRVTTAPTKKQTDDEEEPQQIQSTE